MSTTCIIASATGQTLEIRPVDPEFWTHSGPIEVTRYFCEQDKHFSDQMSRGEIIYHYTNLEALHGIVTGGTLWASDVRLMNDRAELTYALEQMRAAVAATKEGLLRDEALDAVF